MDVVVLWPALGQHSSVCPLAGTACWAQVCVARVESDTAPPNGCAGRKGDGCGMQTLVFSSAIRAGSREALYSSIIVIYSHMLVTCTTARVG